MLTEYNEKMAMGHYPNLVMATDNKREARKSLSHLLSTIFQTWPHIFTMEGPTDMILASNATYTINTLLLFTTVTARNLYFLAGRVNHQVKTTL